MNEVRYSELSNIELREDGLEISGYALVFNKPSVMLGGSNGFVEIIDREALRNVDLSDTHLYYQHNPDDILANSKSGTMRLNVTNEGLHFRANLADTTLGKDVYTLLKRGDLTGMSFGFIAKKDAWDMTTSPETRKILEIERLFEISIVSRPAYNDSVVSVRSSEFLNECRNCRNEESLKQSNYNEKLIMAKEILKSVKEK